MLIAFTSGEAVIHIILGYWMFTAAAIWLVAEAVYLSGKIRGWLAKFQMPTNTYVDQTINQMYGNVNVENREGSNYRKSEHALRKAR